MRLSAHHFIIVLLFLLPIKNFAQQSTIVCKVIDSLSSLGLPGAAIQFKMHTAVADDSGYTRLSVRKGDIIKIVISHVGYHTAEIKFTTADTTLVVKLQAEMDEDEPVIVTSTRTNSRIEDLPARVEVLGAEEMQEENGIKPGNIAGILGDFAGIQIQQTNAATSNADMRIQGLPGKYTQMLRDGMPLYGGFGSSFNILQIPPLDLQQIELIKGSTSTLYGGGAIAGMVNLVSRKPLLHKAERTITLNQTTLNESNVNLFLSGRNEKIGYTLFAGGNYQKAVDVNSDGFSDVANVKSVTVHPRLFWYSKTSTVTIGYSLIYENRIGGDMFVLDDNKNASHQFFIQDKSLRNTVDGIWERKLSRDASLVAKGSVSFYDRHINTNVFGMRALQTTGYGELSYNKKTPTHNWVAGFNYYGDYFKIRQPDSSHLINQSTYTFGCFVQDDWQVVPSVILQAGIRADGFHYTSGRKAFLLPHVSIKYEVKKQLTARVGGGLGYKTPAIFNPEIDERDYKYLAPIPATVKSEQSAGINADLNFKTAAGKWQITINQAFYYTSINDPLLYDSVNGLLVLKNAGDALKTAGIETYIMAKKDPVEIYLGYTYTNATRNYDAVNKNFPLTAHNKAATLISTEIGKHFRTGIESSFIGKQYLDDGAKTDAYVLIACMIRYTIGKINIVLNGENLLDYRQSKKETVVFPPYNNPRFPELWAPSDGRVINLSVQLKW
jgi:outer membrane receptor for ferrienterochelin and colicins